ncbi:FAD-dependent oxidoreductase [Kineosporia sp. A_224]|uniref:oxidoreductase n=1 Tax=Kineosporia sp. A_224 TaxID=1962180 RepID=UPI000B4ACC91|nr:FAD-dependent oxidoreductase [Kineosporia sp. A_224]
MPREAKYDVLFEPIQIGPHTLKNRFWQVPHCNGAGSDRPGFQAAFRGMKAEGGWSAVFTEVCSIAPGGDVMPWVASKLWDAGDVRNLREMTDAIHAHDALAGVELCHPGGLAANAETRAPAKVVSQIASDINYLANGRALSKREIAALRREHVEGFKRAKDAGFDLLTFYAGLGTFPIYFLYPFYNKRTDEYGGSFENRIRFTREVLEDLRSEVDGVAIGMRFVIDTLEDPYGYGDLGVRANGEGKDFIAALDHLVDYWDLNVGTLNWGEDAGSSRFFDTNHEAEYVKVAKQATSKPCINVGRFTDPDVMIGVINSGQADIIGAARPSIADPFLPKKIEEGRFEDIRECIGCNVCVSRWEMGGPPIWCTQNPTSGEEYRRGWHPEKFSTARNADKPVLVVGAGPAGMEAAVVLGKRGFEAVHLVDAGSEMGGHLNWMTTMPGLRAWRRVAEYRERQISKLDNVQFIPNTRMSAQDVREYGAEIVIVATGAHWAGDGMNTPTHDPIAGADATRPDVATPEQLVVEGKQLGDHVLVVDGDGYHMASTTAEFLARQGRRVTYATHWETLGPYLRYTLEEQRMYQRLTELGVTILSQHLVLSYEPGKAQLVHLWGGNEVTLDVDSLALVTGRYSDSALYDELADDQAALDEAGISQLHLVGDAHSPGIIAQATFSGHRLAREIDSPNPDVPLPYIRERRLVGATEDDYTLGAATLLG